MRISDSLVEQLLRAHDNITDEQIADLREKEKTEKKNPSKILL